MSPTVVYRSTHPDALTAWHTAERKADDTGHARRRLLDALGFTGRRALINGSRIIGVEHRAEHGPVPEGWRPDGTTEAIVPDRRRSPGKKIAKRFDALQMPELRKNLPGGMPEMAWDLGNGRIHYPGVDLLGGALYVKWGADPEACESSVRLDPEVWQRVKLSEFYAAMEAADAGADASVRGCEPPQGDAQPVPRVPGPPGDAQATTDPQTHNA